MTFDPSTPILVVDDQPVMVDLVKRFLTALGYERVDQARSLQDAEALIRANSYQLVISDLYLGAGGGLELLRLIQAGEPQQRAQFLLMTGSVEASVAATLAGADGYILKPFTRDGLRAKLHAIAAGRDRAA